MSITLFETILNDTKLAMKAKQKAEVEALRLISNEIKMDAINNKSPLPPADSTSIAILTKLVKQRKDSISQFNNAGRADLAEKEEFQLGVISKYLPAQVSENKLREMVSEKLVELSIKDISGLGKLMQEFKKMPAGTIDMSLVSKIARNILSN